MDNFYLLEKLNKAISEEYANDKVCPSVLFSFLHREKEFYASIVRYPKPGEKIVLFSTRHSHLERCFEKLLDMFVNSNKSSKEELISLLRP